MIGDDRSERGFDLITAIYVCRCSFHPHVRMFALSQREISLRTWHPRKTSDIPSEVLLQFPKPSPSLQDKS